MTSKKEAGRQTIFLVSEIFFPEETSTGYYLTAVAEHLAKLFEVSVLCSAPAGAESTLAKVETYNGIRIRRFGRMSAATATLMRRTFGAFWRMGCIFIRLLWILGEGDAVLTVTNPPFLPPMVALVCLLKRARLVLLVHDVYPDAAVVAGILARGSLVVRLWRRVQRRVYHRANRIICLGKDAKALIAASALGIEAKLVVIPNWAEIRTVRVLKKEDSRFAAAQRITRRFVVLYVGNLGRTHDPELIVDAARRLGKRSEILFLVAATGSQFPGFVAGLELGPNPNIVAVPLPGSRAQQSDTLAAGDVVLITFRADMAGVSVPSRMYNAMAAGKPLIGVTDADSALALVIREESIGWVVPPGDAAALEQAVVEAYTDPVRLWEMGQRARVAAEMKYSPEDILARYQSLFESLTRESVRL